MEPTPAAERTIEDPKCDMDFNDVVLESAEVDVGAIRQVDGF